MDSNPIYFLPAFDDFTVDDTIDLDQAASPIWEFNDNESDNVRR